MERELIEKLANKELIHSYSIEIGGKFYYEQRAMFNMFIKGTEWMNRKAINAYKKHCRFFVMSFAMLLMLEINVNYSVI